jgi:glyoxylase-like metal-dependent hydrolase (beta-lactamase superfamily II)
MIQVASFVFNDFQENTYVLWDETLECVIVDPGCYHPAEQRELRDFISARQLKPVKLLNTHCHIDHILGNLFVSETYQVSLHLHEDELKTYQQASKWAAMLGLPLDQLDPPKDMVFLQEGEKIKFGNSELDIVFTPGHSVASLTFYNLAEQIAIVGDVLFYESIGRTDLPGGNMDTLVSSIRNKLFIWPDAIKLFPGHGPETTIGHEKRNNPFLR